MIHGASGRMGQTLIRLLPEYSQLQLAGLVGRDAETTASGEVILPADDLNRAPKCAICIDFSLPEAFDRIVQHCLDNRIALISGTTGLSPAQKQRLHEAAQDIAIIHSANFSLGVAALRQAVERVAELLPDWSIDIVESHHQMKKDAPSGTALALGEAAQASAQAINYASIRAGDIIGEHTVQFTGAGERVELIHRAMHRDIFAKGALECAQWLVRQPAGLYTVDDVLNERAI